MAKRLARLDGQPSFSDMQLIMFQLEDGSKFKVWLLAPLLTALLNACFTRGTLPAGISSALGHPCPQKGLYDGPFQLQAHSCGGAALSHVYHHS